MAYDDDDSYENHNLIKTKAKLEDDIPESPSKKVNTHKKRNNKISYDEEITEEPTNIKWLIFGCVIVALMFALLTNWTSAPKQDVVKANHLQRSKNRKVKVVSAPTREARGFSQNY